MNFVKKGLLYLAGQTDTRLEPSTVDLEIPKGRSMVGYSRRGFLGLVAATAAVAFSETIIPSSQREVIRRVAPRVAKQHLLREVDVEAYRYARMQGLVIDATLSPKIKAEIGGLSSREAVMGGIFPQISVIPHLRREYLFEQMPRIRFRHLPKPNLPA